MSEAGHETTAGLAVDRRVAGCMVLSGRSGELAISERTEAALESCFDAALAPERWPVALQLLAESLGAESSTFCSCQLQQQSSKVMPVSTGHMAFAERWLRLIDGAPDPHFVMNRYSSRTGYSVVVEEQVTTPEEREVMAYYNEIARPADREWWAMSCFTVRGTAWSLPLYRGQRRGPFTAEEARSIGVAAPHVARVVTMAERLDSFRIATELAALDRMDCAALVLDVNGMVTAQNRRAEVMMGPEFGVSRRRVFASDPGSSRRLHGLIGAALASEGKASALLEPVVIYRDERPWLLAEVMPVTEFGSNFFGAGLILLLVTDLVAAAPPDQQKLRLAFGLTQAEARLAARLTEGLSLEDAAAGLGVSRATVSTQLQSIFAKTGVRRQAELTALLARFRPMARSRPL